MTATNNSVISKLVNDIQYRTTILSGLTLKNRIEVSTLIERYTRLNKERLAIVGKLYGNKRYQAVDEQLKSSMVIIRTKIESLIN